MAAKTVMIGVWVTPTIKERTESRAAEQGMKVGEYIRRLIANDLEKSEVN